MDRRRRHTLVWRFPRYQNEIKNGAQLIVRPGQVAVFVHRGQIADVFEPGTTRSRPTTCRSSRTLAGWKYGFNSPFQAEVYFVSTRQITDLQVGHAEPDHAPRRRFRPRARCARSAPTRCGRSTPRRCSRSWSAPTASFEADEITELMRVDHQPAFADLVGEGQDRARSTWRRTTASCRSSCGKMVIERVDDEYGLDVPQLYIVNISLPEEVEKALDTRAQHGRDRRPRPTIRQYQLGAAMPVAAANPAGGIAGAGVGVGMGMAIAGRFTRARARRRRRLRRRPRRGTCVERGQAVGPWSPEQLAQAVAAGRVGPDTLVWCAGMTVWAAARSVPALAALFGTPPPPPR